MPTPVLAYLVALPVFLALDAVWLSIMAPRLYKATLGDVVLESFALAPAALFYLLYGVGLVVFAVLPGLASGRLLTTFGHGALFGLVAYGTYNLTNLATLKPWTTQLAVVDMTWGAVATGLAAVATVAVLGWVGRG